MVRKQGDRNVNSVGREKIQTSRNKPNYQVYSQNLRNSAQAQNTDAVGHSAQSAGQGHYPSSRNTRNYGYYRDRGKENDRDALSKHHSGTMTGRLGGQRNKTEETIEDIKQDIIRLEKEIELEIKEIRSLKL